MPAHKIYPYLLRGIAITRPNQVWAMDITYIPMAGGFVYLAIVLDWFSRRVLSWRERSCSWLAFNEEVQSTHYHFRWHSEGRFQNGPPSFERSEVGTYHLRSLK